MSWESSLVYYRMVNETVRDRVGGLHSADCVLRSVDFAAVEALQRTGRWVEAGATCWPRGRARWRAGAPSCSCSARTPCIARRRHRRGDRHTARAHRRHHRRRRAGRVTAPVGLLGTAYTMESDFYVGRLRERHGLDVLDPGRPTTVARARRDYRELCVGVVERRRATSTAASWATSPTAARRASCSAAPSRPARSGRRTRRSPVFDTTRLHAESAVELALAGNDGP